MGKTIYEMGIPEANVAACSACHGPEAKGQEEIPRLAGQLFPYTVKQLTGWGKERGESLAAIMVPTTHNLTQSTDCRCRGLYQLYEVNPICLQGTRFDECVKHENFDHETHQFTNGNPGDCFFFAASPLLAGEPVPVRNCTWCHGIAAQGLSTAPRLAGQRDQYIENVSFSALAITPAIIRIHNSICGVPRQISVSRPCMI